MGRKRKTRWTALSIGESANEEDDCSLVDEMSGLGGGLEPLVLCTSTSTSPSHHHRINNKVVDKLTTCSVKMGELVGVGGGGVNGDSGSSPVSCTSSSNNMNNCSDNNSCSSASSVNGVGGDGGTSGVEGGGVVVGGSNGYEGQHNHNSSHPPHHHHSGHRGGKPFNSSRPNYNNRYAQEGSHYNNGGGRHYNNGEAANGGGGGYYNRHRTQYNNGSGGGENGSGPQQQPQQGPGGGYSAGRPSSSYQYGNNRYHRKPHRPYYGAGDQNGGARPSYNQDEYTKITTPRQDVLFKKGYLSQKKPATEGATGGSTTAATTATTGGSAGDSANTTPTASTNGTPDTQSTNGVHSDYSEGYENGETECGIPYDDTLYYGPVPEAVFTDPHTGQLYYGHCSTGGDYYDAYPMMMTGYPAGPVYYHMPYPGPVDWNGMAPMYPVMAPPIPAVEEGLSDGATSTSGAADGASSVYKEPVTEASQEAKQDSKSEKESDKNRDKEETSQVAEGVDLKEKSEKETQEATPATSSTTTTAKSTEVKVKGEESGDVVVGTEQTEKEDDADNVSTKEKRVEAQDVPTNTTRTVEEKATEEDKCVELGVKEVECGNNGEDDGSVSCSSDEKASEVENGGEKPEEDKEVVAADSSAEELKTAKDGGEDSSKGKLPNEKTTPGTNPAAVPWTPSGHHHHNHPHGGTYHSHAQHHGPTMMIPPPHGGPYHPHHPHAMTGPHHPPPPYIPVQTGGSGPPVPGGHPAMVSYAPHHGVAAGAPQFIYPHPGFIYGPPIYNGVMVPYGADVGYPAHSRKKRKKRHRRRDGQWIDEGTDESEDFHDELHYYYGPPPDGMLMTMEEVYDGEGNVGEDGVVVNGGAPLDNRCDFEKSSDNNNDHVQSPSTTRKKMELLLDLSEREYPSFASVNASSTTATAATTTSVPSTSTSSTLSSRKCSGEEAVVDVLAVVKDEKEEKSVEKTVAPVEGVKFLNFSAAVKKAAPAPVVSTPVVPVTEVPKEGPKKKLVVEMESNWRQQKKQQLQEQEGPLRKKSISESAAVESPVIAVATPVPVVAAAPTKTFSQVVAGAKNKEQSSSETGVGKTSTKKAIATTVEDNATRPSVNQSPTRGKLGRSTSYQEKEWSQRGETASRRGKFSDRGRRNRPDLVRQRSGDGDRISDGRRPPHHYQPQQWRQRSHSSHEAEVEAPKFEEQQPKKKEKPTELVMPPVETGEAPDVASEVLAVSEPTSPDSLNTTQSMAGSEGNSRVGDTLSISECDLLLQRTASIDEVEEELPVEEVVEVEIEDEYEEDEPELQDYMADEDHKAEQEDETNSTDALLEEIAQEVQKRFGEGSTEEMMLAAESSTAQLQQVMNSVVAFSAADDAALAKLDATVYVDRHRERPQSITVAVTEWLKMQGDDALTPSHLITSSGDQTQEEEDESGEVADGDDGDDEGDEDEDLELYRQIQETCSRLHQQPKNVFGNPWTAPSSNNISTKDLLSNAASQLGPGKKRRLFMTLTSRRNVTTCCAFPRGGFMPRGSNLAVPQQQQTSATATGTNSRDGGECSRVASVASLNTAVEEAVKTEAAAAVASASPPKTQNYDSGLELSSPESKRSKRKKSKRQRQAAAAAAAAPVVATPSTLLTPPPSADSMSSSTADATDLVLTTSKSGSDAGSVIEEPKSEKLCDPKHFSCYYQLGVVCDKMTPERDLPPLPDQTTTATAPTNTHKNQVPPPLPTPTALESSPDSKIPNGEQVPETMKAISTEIDEPKATDTSSSTAIMVKPQQTACCVIH